MKDSQDWLVVVTGLYADYYANKITLGELSDGVEGIVRKHILQAVEQELEEFCTQIQDRADTTPPNLLLNEVVNIKWDRVAELRNKFNDKYKED